MMYKKEELYLTTRNSIFYFVRRVPRDLIQYYSFNRISFSLKTKSKLKALRVSSTAKQKLEDYWLGLRLQKLDIPQILIAKDKVNSQKDHNPTLTQALDLYLKLKGQGRDRVFFRTARRNIRYVTDLLGNRSLSLYTSKDAGKFRDWLLDKGLQVNSVKRIFSSIRSIINICISENGLDCSNAFARTYMPSEDNKPKRSPIPSKNLQDLRYLCKKMDDDLRWLLALLIDSGLRLGEATGLATDDIVLDHDIPHVKIRPHPWRRLKTIGSERDVPLVGISLWAAKRIKEQGTYHRFAFPRYTNSEYCNAN